MNMRIFKFGMLLFLSGYLSIGVAVFLIAKSDLGITIQKVITRTVGIHYDITNWYF